MDTWSLPLPVELNNDCIIITNTHKYTVYHCQHCFINLLSWTNDLYLLVSSTLASYNISYITNRYQNTILRIEKDVVVWWWRSMHHIELTFYVYINIRVVPMKYFFQDFSEFLKRPLQNFWKILKMFPPLHT